jgi:hypothetical protein
MTMSSAGQHGPLLTPAPGGLPAYPRSALISSTGLEAPRSHVVAHDDHGAVPDLW